MKHCTDCKYCLNKTGNAAWFRCIAPKAVALHDLALVDAKEKPYCLDMRKDNQFCGPDAKWFEAKE